MTYDTIIIGAGPAGIFAAKYLEGNGRTLLIEKGDATRVKECPISSECYKCQVCRNICGVGGAGGRSDGKLTYGKVGISPEYYGRNYEKEMKKVLAPLLDNAVLHHNLVTPENPIECGTSYSQEAVQVYHLGTSEIQNAFQKIYDQLTCEKLLNCSVISFEYHDSVFHLHTTKGDYVCRSLIIATGKGDINLEHSLDAIGIQRTGVQSSIGIRLELPKSGLNYMKSKSNNLKIKKHYNGAYVKTHCVCYSGEIVPYRAQGIALVGGRADPYVIKETSNVNILHRSERLDSLHDVLSSLKRFEQVSGGNVMYQTIDDFLGVNISGGVHIPHQKWEREGKVNQIFDTNVYEQIKDFLLTIHQDGLIDLRNGLVHAPAAEWIVQPVQVDFNFETNVHGLFVVGDGSGKTQGILSAAVSAQRAANTISYREKDAA